MTSDRQIKEKSKKKRSYQIVTFYWMKPRGNKNTPGLIRHLTK